MITLVIIMNAFTIMISAAS